jgi:hypothetical protein
VPPARTGFKTRAKGAPMNDMNTRSESSAQPIWCTSKAEVQPPDRLPSPHRRRLLASAARHAGKIKAAGNV